MTQQLYGSAEAITAGSRPSLRDYRRCVRYRPRL